MARQRVTNPQASIFELIKLTHKFIRDELVHASVGTLVFFIIFLIFKPWEEKRHHEENNPAWFIGPPLIYFTLDLFLAVMLHFSLKNELRPKPCLLWSFAQIANLILLTFTGFYTVWNFYYKGNTWIRLVLALIVMYCYKSYRIGKMHVLINEMRARCNNNMRVNPPVIVVESLQPTKQDPNNLPYVITFQSTKNPNSTC